MPLLLLLLMMMVMMMMMMMAMIIYDTLVSDVSLPSHRHLTPTSCYPSDVLALDLEGVHDVKLHHPSSYVATSNQ